MRWFISALWVSTMICCASVPPPPVQERASAMAAIQEASSTKGRAHTNARAYLDAARSRFEDAEGMIEDEEMRRASLMYQEAETDAVIAKRLIELEALQGRLERSRARLEQAENEARAALESDGGER